MSTCKATVKRTGQQCRKLAMRGGLVCGSHGGRAPQVRAAAARRQALAQAVAAADRRQPGAILLDTLHVSDVLLRQAIDAAGATMTPEQLAAVIGHLERAQSFARGVLSAGVEERQVALAERTADAVTAVLEAVLDELDLTERQQSTARRALPGHLTRLRQVVAG